MLTDFDLSVCEDQNKRKSYFIEIQGFYNLIHIKL
jgi:hypothetical protein